MSEKEKKEDSKIIKRDGHAWLKLMTVTLFAALLIGVVIKILSHEMGWENGEGDEEVAYSGPRVVKLDVTLSGKEFLTEKKICGLSSGKWRFDVTDTKFFLKKNNGEISEIGSILGGQTIPGEKFPYVQSGYRWGLVVNGKRIGSIVKIGGGCAEIAFNIPLSQRPYWEKEGWTLKSPVTLHFVFYRQ
ncbi:MAG: hypothetical protein HYV45_01990 [Candidatus Moranbacteria bacterium]|nr:hypothetical protein [Candidatus Moranbacteria bacterium]